MAEPHVFPSRFTGRTALVTGAAQGLGRAVATRLAAEGAAVILADRNEAGLAAAVEAIRAGHDDGPGDARVRGEILDVTDAARVKEVFARAGEADGGIDVLVNNAGILRDAWIEKMSNDDWHAVLDVHLTGAFLCTRAAVPQMRAGGYGRIVNMSSRSWMGNPGQSNYSAAKAGLVGLTRTLALELAGFGITVNAVAPGFIDTPMTQDLKPDVRDFLIAAQPGRRMGRPEEVAAAVLFLASQEASFITGQVLHVCGGKSAGMGGVA